MRWVIRRILWIALSCCSEEKSGDVPLEEKLRYSSLYAKQRGRAIEKQLSELASKASFAEGSESDFSALFVPWY